MNIIIEDKGNVVYPKFVSYIKDDLSNFPIWDKDRPKDLSSARRMREMLNKHRCIDTITEADP